MPPFLSVLVTLVLMFDPISHFAHLDSFHNNTTGPLVLAFRYGGFCFLC